MGGSCDIGALRERSVAGLNANRLGVVEAVALLSKWVELIEGHLGLLVCRRLAIGERARNLLKLRKLHCPLRDQRQIVGRRVVIGMVEPMRVHKVGILTADPLEIAVHLLHKGGNRAIAVILRYHVGGIIA